VARNIEIKATARDFERQALLAKQMSDRFGVVLSQEDTFFNVPHGRLKLRVFQNNTGELIQYHRDDMPGPTESRYVRSLTKDPERLKEALSNALGVRAVVRKKRTVYWVGQTRIHLDVVENLGHFIELEVVLAEEQRLEQGVVIAEQLMKELDILEGDLIESAYVDLLENTPLLIS